MPGLYFDELVVGQLSKHATRRSVAELDGVMLDMPHLKQAQRVLARHAAHG